MNTAPLPSEPIAASAVDFPPMSAPAKEHAWLERFVGEWETEAEICCQPGMPPMKCAGTESARLLGGFWIVAQGLSSMAEMPFENVLTLGYAPQKQRSVGTWVDSMTSNMWHYEGSVGAAGNTLSLDTNGPCPADPDKVSRFREVTEFLNADHRVFTSSIEDGSGEWRVIVTVNFRRKK